MKSLIVIPIVLITFICFPAIGQDPNYHKVVGPYLVNLTLPGNIAVVTDIRNNIQYGEELDGTAFTSYALEFPRLGTEETRGFGYVEVRKYDSPRTMDLDGEIERSEELARSSGYTAINSAHRIIDGHEGIVIEMLGPSLVDTYWFAYQLDNRTIVEGITHFGWNEGTLIFLKRLHVEASHNA